MSRELPIPTLREVTLELLLRQGKGQALGARAVVDGLMLMPSESAVAIAGGPWVGCRAAAAQDSAGRPGRSVQIEADLPITAPVETPIEIVFRMRFDGGSQVVLATVVTDAVRAREIAVPERAMDAARRSLINGDEEAGELAGEWRLQWLRRFGPPLRPPEPAVRPGVSLVHLSGNAADVAFTVSSLPSDAVRAVTLVACAESAPNFPVAVPVAVATVDSARWSTRWWCDLLAHAPAEYVVLVEGRAKMMPGAIDRLLCSIQESGAAIVAGRSVTPTGWWDGELNGQSPTALHSKALYRRPIEELWSSWCIVRKAVLQDMLTSIITDRPWTPSAIGRECIRRGHTMEYDPAAVVVQPLSALQQTGFSVGAAKRFMASSGTQLCQRRTILLVEDPERLLPCAWGDDPARRLVDNLLSLGWTVTIFPPQRPSHRWSDLHDALPAGVEVLYDASVETFPSFLSERGVEFNAAWISRVGAIAAFGPALEEFRRTRHELLVIHGLGGLPSIREILRQQVLAPRTMPVSYVDMLINRDVFPSKFADAVVVENEFEGRECALRGIERVHVLGTPARGSASDEPFSARSGVCAVGAALSDEAPSADGVYWFAREVVPIFSGRVPAGGATVTFGGATSPVWERKVLRACPVVFERPLCLADFFARFRVHVAPRRYDCGCAPDVVLAAAHGIPVVCTGVVAQQMGWRHGEQAFVANSAEEFAEGVTTLLTAEHVWQRLRAQALAWIAEHADPAMWSEALQAVLATPIRRNAKALDLLDLSPIRAISIDATQSLS